MKPLSFILLLIQLVFFMPARAQSNGGDHLIGVWETQNGKARIKITKSSNYFYGRIIWIKDSLDEQNKPKVDQNNPDPENQKRLLIETPILWGLEYTGEDVWKDGSIYNPQNGKTYKCKITKNGQAQLNIRGYSGISMFGKTRVWKRVG